MVNNYVANSYLQNKVESASPIGRILLLFEGCFKFIDKSRDALKAGDKVTFVEKNIRAQNIIRELRNSLNLDVDEKIAGGLYSLYNYLLKQLMQSVRTRTIAPLDEVSKHLQTLYESWKKAEAQGLGRDIKRPEERAKSKDLGLTRTFQAKESHYLKASAGLNLVS
jgi:flagellar protein FliS